MMTANKHKYKMNFGPQHPSAHGALRLVLEMDGETICKVDPHIGFLHRATEKLAECKIALQNIPFMDRLDYMSALCNEHAYVLAIEKLLNINPPLRAQYIRVMFDEVTRILSHLLWLGTHALDVGAMSVFLYCFREREDLLDCHEAVSGSRMHPCYYRIGGVARDLPNQMSTYKVSKWHSIHQVVKRNRNRGGHFLDFLEDFTNRFPDKMKEYEKLLTRNRIWQQRTKGIGVLSKEQALQLGCTGPVLRSTGIDWDLRKKQPYAVYDQLDFVVPTGSKGDCYDRYLVRMEEMRQANRLIQQCIAWLREHPGPVIIDDYKLAPPNKIKVKQEMEAMIHHFKLFTEGHFLPKGEVYSAIEHPKGEFGVYLMADGSNKPYRLKIRSAGFAHLAAIDHMARGHMLADLVTIIGSQDIVMGEVDR